jgi:hypothetical protein
MPFRTKELLQTWIEEFVAAEPQSAPSLDVLRHDGDIGDDTGLVIVQLEYASTDVYLQPVAPGNPAWEVHFGARPQDFALDAERVQQLAEKLALASRLCAFFEQKSRDHAASLQAAAPLENAV